MANDGYTIKQAEAQGIKRGTEQFNEFVAAKALAEQELKSQEEIAKDAHNAL